MAVLLAASVSASPMEPSPAQPAEADAVTIELRFWQLKSPHLWKDLRVWVSARPEGGRWSTLGTVPLEFGRGQDPDLQYAVLAIAGVELRISNPRYPDMASIRVYPCGLICSDLTDAGACESRGDLVPLDDGYSSSGRYRYGDATIEVPLSTPRLLMDRERLLAMRDTLAGTATLDWSSERHIDAWEGVSVEGSPPRVTKLDLTARGLTGELTGLLGDLTALTELRLGENALTGRIPTKLTQLHRLALLYLGGNPLEGCVPSSLRMVTDTDIQMLELPDCRTPRTFVMSDSGEALSEGSYVPVFWDGDRSSLVFDVSAGDRLRTFGVVTNGLVAVVLEHDTGLLITISLSRCGPSWISDHRVEPAVRATMQRLAESRWWDADD